MKSSPAARELIKRFEPFHEVAARGPDGRWRVGFGHRAAARDGVRVSRDDASLLLIYDVMQAEAAIDEMFPAPLPRVQRDALTSFVHDIGATAFRTSDVARYLFEGRVEAAAEALAAYGDTSSERREAESAMLLSSLEDAPAASVTAPRAAMVDLVIKVEHAEEEAQPAPALRERPALPDSLMPPPPPPMMTQKAIARREAESEIARILATVGAMPVVDEPADTHAVAESAPAPAAASEAEPEPEPEAEIAAAPEAEPETEIQADSVVDAPVDSVPAVEAGADFPETPGAESEPEAQAAPEPEPVVLPETAPEQAPEAAPVSAQVIARMSQEIAHVQTAIVGRFDRRELTPDEPDDLPEGASLGYVFTGSMAASLEITESVVPSHVAADDAPGEPEPAEADAEEDALVESAEPSHPEAMTPADDEALEPAIPADEVAGEAIADAPEEAAGEIIEDVAGEAAAETADEMDEDAARIGAAESIVERTLAVAGDRNPPPHPADAPAPSSGSVGEIMRERAETDDESDSAHPAHLDDLATVSGQTQQDTLAGDDAFSPSDLVGTTDVFIESKPADPGKKEDGWGFVVALVAGLVVTGAGVMDIVGDWPRVWLDRDPTWGVLASAAGLFLVVTAAWFLWTILAANRKPKTTD